MTNDQRLTTKDYTMKNFFKPARIGFYILMLLVFFIIGLYFAGYIEAGKNQGLAGGAIVLGYGVMFGGIAFVASFFIAHFLEIKKIKIINWAFLVLLLATYGYTHYKFNQRKTEHKVEDESYQNTTPTETAEPATANSVMQLTKPFRKGDMGVGFFKPNFYEHPTLYFYGNVNLEKGLLEHMPQDSLVMGKNQYGDFTSTYAPPYLLPEYMKLDYGLFYFKTLGVSHDMVLIEINKQDGQTAYLSKSQGNLLLWPEFLMGVNSVKVLDQTQQVKIKPLDHAGDVVQQYTFLKPLLVKDQWMQVALQDSRLKTVGTGWICWQKNGALLISFDFLS